MAAEDLVALGLTLVGEVEDTDEIEGDLTPKVVPKPPVSVQPGGRVLAIGPWVAIPATSMPPTPTIQRMAEDLTLEPVVCVGGVRRRSGTVIPAFEQKGEFFCVPRAYYAARGDLALVDDNTSLGAAIPDDVAFCGTFRNEEQRTFVRDLAAHLSRHERTGGAIALGSGEPGCGKTACFLFLWANVLRRKALVVVRGLSILAQWVFAVRRFVPRARVGVIVRDTWELEDRDIVIASADTLAARAAPAALWDHFGAVCFDEAHHIVAATLVAVYRSCVRARFCVSLTGTPDRKDGLTHAMPAFTGPNVATMKNREVVHVRRIHYEGGAQERVEHRWGPAKGNPNDAAMITKLAEDPARQRLLFRILVDCLRAGRKVLVLSGRKELRSILREWVLAEVDAQAARGDAVVAGFKAEMVPSIVEDRPHLSRRDAAVLRLQRLLDRRYAATFLDPTAVSGLDERIARTQRRMSEVEIANARARCMDACVVPRLVEDPDAPVPRPLVEELCAEDSVLVRAHKFRARVLLATYEMAREALDVDGLDTLVMATPAVDVRQAVGRIRRGGVVGGGEDSRTRPLLQRRMGIVIDVADAFDPFVRWARSRADYYRREARYVQVSERHVGDGDVERWCN